MIDKRKREPERPNLAASTLNQVKKKQRKGYRTSQ